ncbi:MAG: cysteine desulfurase [Candidatus Eisenbacteria bacterium]|nr:cysteine desulfurase [Candidatus Eisenbacteria bacterium]
MDAAALKREFPILSRTVNGRPLVYLDNAATSQKPQAVIDAITGYYTDINANIHRGVHWLSQQATGQYEAARESARRFINAEFLEEIVFVRGTTEAINLVAQTYGRTRIGKGDEIVISHLEHHSNIVPWQILCAELGATLRVVPINDAGEFMFDEYVGFLNERTRLVATAHVSNALGTIMPVREIVATAHARGIPVLLDGAQAVPHMKVDVQSLDVDFYTFSGHKMFGPTGIGVLYGKSSWLNSLPPWQGGGDMILSVSFDGTVYNKPPFKFEAGTPNIEGGIGLGAAIQWLENVGIERVTAYEEDLLAYGTAELLKVPGLKLIGTARHKAGVLSFTLEGIHPHDIGTILDQAGIAIRTGHHCAQPVMDRFKVPATARASLALYNTREDIDDLVHGLDQVVRMFR